MLLARHKYVPASNRRTERIFSDPAHRSAVNTQTPQCELQTSFLSYRLYHLFYMHCNFICGLSDVITKTFSQSVSLRQLEDDCYFLGDHATGRANPEFGEEDSSGGSGAKPQVGSLADRVPQKPVIIWSFYRNNVLQKESRTVLSTTPCPKNALLLFFE